MLKISFAIICKNESASIDRCLESLIGADEIIIIDTGSTDSTRDVVNKFKESNIGTTEVEYYENSYVWNDNFAEARNYANSKCTGDWIFVIDADNHLVSSIEDVRKEVEKAEAKGFKTVEVGIWLERGNRYSHHLPILYKNCKEVFWNGAIHNYISVRDSDGNSDLKISCWWGESHTKDPDRSLRILRKECAEKPNCVREKYYLGREYHNRGDYINSNWWMMEYLKVATWGKEMADANLTIARNYWYLGKGDLARAFCLEAICLDANFKEAILLMAEMSGPKNRERWINFAEDANEKDVLFVRHKIEQGSDFYDTAFKANSDMSRYEDIQKEIGEWVGESSVLDVGCGTATLSKYVKNYKGFDFSEEAIKIANNPNCWAGSVYDKENYKDADAYVSTETLEHLDDLKLIENIPSGKRFIFSVPSFNDTAHLRVYTEWVVKERFKDLDIKKITRFNWNDKWDKNSPNTYDWILLCDSIKK